MKVSDIIIIAWQKGQLSEGKAASLIGVDRLTLRTMRDELAAQHSVHGTGLNGGAKKVSRNVDDQAILLIVQESLIEGDATPARQKELAKMLNRVLYCHCKRYVNKPMTTAVECAFCGKPPRP